MNPLNPNTLHTNTMHHLTPCSSRLRPHGRSRLSPRVLALHGLLVAVLLLAATPALAQVTDASSNSGPQMNLAEEDADDEDLDRIPQFGLGARLGVLFAAERDRDPLFESDSTAQIGLALDVQPFGSLIPNDRLRFGLEWMSGNSNATLFQIFTADYTDHHLYATAEYGYRVLDWLVPYVRLGVGVAFYDLEISSGQSLSARDHWLFSSYASGGIEFVTTGWVVDLGARMEGGYALRQHPEFTLESNRQTPEDEDDIPLQGTPIGELTTSGGLFTFEVFVRY